MVTGTWEFEVKRFASSNFEARFDPIQRLSFSMLSDAILRAQHETEDVPSWPDGDVFEEIIWLISPDADMYFSVLNAKIGAFPNQIDFIRNNLSRTIGWQNLMAFMNKTDMKARHYRRIVTEFMEDLDLTSLLQVRKNDGI